MRNWKDYSRDVALVCLGLVTGLGLYATAPISKPVVAAHATSLAAVEPFAAAPIEPAISLPATVKSVYDGDTMRVRVTFEMPVRLRDCWAPELNEKGGIDSRNHLRLLCPAGSLVVVRIPFHEDVSHMLTMGRVVGDILLKNGQSAAKVQVSSGNAAISKPR